MKFLKITSLKGKIILWTGGIVAVMFISIIYFASTQFEEALKESIYRDLASKNQVYLRTVKKTFDGKKDILLAYRDDLENLSNRGEIWIDLMSHVGEKLEDPKKIREMQRKLELFRESYLSDKNTSPAIEKKLSKIWTKKNAYGDGMKFFYTCVEAQDLNHSYQDSSGWSPQRNYNPLIRPWCIAGKSAERDGVKYTEPYAEMRTREALIAMGTPIQIEGKIGALAVGISINPLMESIQFDKNSEITIISKGVSKATQYVTKAPKYIYSTRNPELSDHFRGYNEQDVVNLDFMNLYNLTKDKKSGVIAYIINGEERLVAFDTVPGVNWKIFNDVSSQEMLAPVRSIQSKTILITIFGLSILLSIIFWVVKKSLEPVIRITREVKELAQPGDLTRRVKVSGNDEIGIMGKAVNEMLEEIESTKEELRKTNEGLEEQVQYRTIELEKSVNLLKTIFDTVPIPLIISDIKTGKFLKTNPAYAEFHKLALEQLATFSTFEMYADSNDRSRILTEIDEKGQAEVQLTVMGDKTVRWVILKGKSIIYDGVKAILAGFVDITDQKNLEHETTIAKEKAEEATKAKSDFLANMSHEIRTPMNAVLGMTHLCLQTNLTQQQEDYLDKVYKSAKSLLGIINDILDFSKIEAGKLNMEHIDFHLDDVLENVSIIISEKTNRKKLEFLIQSPPDIRKCLIGDPLRLKQILINLANNAVKFTEEGEVVISISKLEESSDRITLQFIVRDTGIGMTEKQILKLFKSFTQADASTTRRFGGTGLGLAISKSLVEIMGGKIWVSSKLGQGSSFYFTATFKYQPSDKRENLALTEDIKGLRVLVVDDNEIALQIFREILESFNFVVDIASNGHQAIDMVSTSSKPFDVIIVDWKMPGLNGLETCLQIKHNLDLIKRPKIILCTSYGREEIVRKAFEAQLDGFLIKPVNPSILLDTILESFGKAPIAQVSKSIQNLTDNAGLNKIRGARILLVEDNELNQQIATKLLEGQGFFIEIANNGKEGVEMALTHQYDIVLMDIQMPVMGGYEATEMIRKEEALNNLPIVAMTANAMMRDREKAMKSGMVDYVIKPIDPENLYSTLVKWINPNRIQNPFQSTKKHTIEKETIFIPDFKEIDVKKGLLRLNQNQSLYLKLLKKFKSKNLNFLEDLKESLKKNDYTTIERLNHILKGVSGNMGLNPLYKISKRLDKILKDENFDRNKVAQTFVELESELDSIFRVIDEISKLNTQRISPLQTSIDIDKVINIIEDLKQQIKDSDLGAIKNYEKLKKEVGSKVKNVNLDPLEAKIEEYDFDGALSILEEINIDSFK